MISDVLAIYTTAETGVLAVVVDGLVEIFTEVIPLLIAVALVFFVYRLIRRGLRTS